MDKTSYYNIEVKHEEYMLLYNTLTDSMIALTKDEYEVVEFLLNDLVSFREEYPTLYNEFKTNGFIIAEDFGELDYIRLQNTRQIFSNSNYHITIHPTLDCNLTCWYCSTEFSNAQHSGGMNADTLQRTLAHIHPVLKKEKASSLRPDWFGGEPLMYFDETITPISRYANKLVVECETACSQHITTHAVWLDEARIHQTKDFNFTSFQIPIDGNEQRHNKIKFSADNQGTYRTVVDNINKIAEIIPDVYITLRINYDLQTLKNIKEIIKDSDKKSKAHIQVDFQKVWQTLFKIYPYAINYDGRIFKCTARDYGEDKVIGTLAEDGRVNGNDKLMSKLFVKPTFDNARCLRCKKLPVGMGPCIQKNYDARTQATDLPCISGSVPYTLESDSSEDAKKRKLIS